MLYHSDGKLPNVIAEVAYFNCSLKSETKS